MVLNILFLSHYYASFFVKHQGRQIYQSQAEKADWLSAPSNCNIFCVHILFLWPLLNNLWAWPGPTVVSVKTSTYCSTARIFTLAFCSALRRKMVSAGMKSKSPLGTQLPFAAHVWSTTRGSAGKVFLLVLVDYTTLLKPVSVKFWAMG